MLNISSNLLELPPSFYYHVQSYNLYCFNKALWKQKRSLALSPDAIRCVPVGKAESGLETCHLGRAQKNLSHCLSQRQSIRAEILGSKTMESAFYELLTAWGRPELGRGRGWP